MAERIELYEVGARDGLQNEARHVPTDEKIRLIDLLSDCGFERIEVSSFVSPRWVPQMADAADVFAGIRRRSGVRYGALAPNLRGLDAALAANAGEVAIFGSASEGFSRKNIGCSVEESFARFAPVLERARDVGIPVRGYVSCVVACPFDGAVAPGAVADIAERLTRMGCYEISLGDTIGAGTADTISAMLDAVTARVPADQLAGHYHDTGGRALANIDASLAHGLRVFDSSVGGLGGCPYAPGAPGNVATEAVDAHLTAQGYDTGLDRDALQRAADFARTIRSGAA